MSTSSNRPVYEWTARIECGKYELGTSYSVIVFLGQVPDNPRDWEISPNYVGSHRAPVDGVPRGGKDVIIQGFVHLERAIARRSGLHSLDPDVVVPYLTKNLAWRVLSAGGEPVRDLKSLEVTVFATPLSRPPGSVFPVPGTPIRYDSITYGQNGGSRHPPTS